MKSEIQIQSECVMWMRNTKPETRGLFFGITNNAENIGRAMQRKAAGLVAGVADTCFLWRGRAWFIEFKRPGENQSEDQMKWERLIESHNFDYFVVRTLSQFQTLISHIMQIKIELSKDQEYELFQAVLDKSIFSGDFSFQDTEELYRLTVEPSPIGYNQITEFSLIEGDDLTGVDVSDVNQMLREEWYS